MPGLFSLSASAFSAIALRSRSHRRPFMGKSKKVSRVPNEQYLNLPPHPRFADYTTPFIDTHTHLLSTYQRYRSLYPNSSYEDVFSFVRAMYGASIAETGMPRHRTEAIVDVWCEAPVTMAWKELADSSLSLSEREQKWGGVDYWFVMGVHPHEVENYTEDVEREILQAMDHPRCVGWGEIGLDYKVSQAPHAMQRSVLERQLRHAVRIGKPITIHTREAEEDTERILKAEVPKTHPMHIHCFTDSPELALRLINHFPNLYIGITGVITYASNFNTTNLIRALVTTPTLSLRILLETDAPYMIPSNIYRDLRSFPPGSKLPISHSGMIPWTAEWVSNVATEAARQSHGSGDAGEWSVERVMREARDNARSVYGV